MVRPYAADEDHAKDLISDCWVAILEGLDQYRGLGSFDSWALAVSENVGRMRLRAAKRRRETALEDPTSVLDDAPDPEEELMQKERRKALACAINELPERERDAIMLHMIEERDIPETAEAMGVSRPVARSLVERGMAKLCRMEQVRQCVMDWMD